MHLRIPILFTLISSLVITNGQNDTFNSTTSEPATSNMTISQTTTSPTMPDPEERVWTLSGTWSQMIVATGRFMSFSIATDEDCEIVRFSVVCPAGNYWCGFGIGGNYHGDSSGSDSGSEEHSSEEVAESEDRRRLSFLGRRLLASSEDGNFSSTSSHHGEDVEGEEMNGYSVISSMDSGDLWESTLEAGATPNPQTNQDLYGCSVEVVGVHRTVVCYREYNTGNKDDEEDFKDFSFGKNNIIFAIGNMTDGVMMEHASGGMNRHYDVMLLHGDEDDQCGYAGDELQQEKDQDKEDEAWFIVGIVFICAFGVLLLAVIGYFVWLKFFHTHEHGYSSAGGSHGHDHHDHHETQNIVGATDD